MANTVYPKALIALMKAQIDLETANIKAILVDTADEWLCARPGRASAHRVAWARHRLG